MAASGVQLGLLNLVCLPTSCGLTMNEYADSLVSADLAVHLRALVPKEGIRPVSGRGELRPYAHADAGCDDMPSAAAPNTASSSLPPYQTGCTSTGQ